MRIRFRKATNIRKDNSSLKTEPVGEVYANTELEVDGTLHEGAEIDGNSGWWRDGNGWFYWAGETEPIVSDHPDETPIPPVILPPVILPPVAPLPPAPLPPVVALELVALPASDDLKADFLRVPEGEWQPDNKDIPVAPRPKKEKIDGGKILRFKRRFPNPTPANHQKWAYHKYRRAQPFGL